MIRSDNDERGDERPDARSLMERVGSWIGFFVDGARFDDRPDDERRARLIVTCGATATFWGPFFALAYWLAGFPSIAVGVVGAAATIGASLFALRAGFPPVVVGNLVAGAIFAIHGMMVLETGGALSPALPWLSIFTIAGFALAGPRSGLVWLVISAIELFALSFALESGVVLPPIADTHVASWLSIAAVSGLCGTVFTFARAFESQKDRSFKALIRANEREREASETKSLFLANMSHEVRTPMNAVLGMTELVLRANLPEVERQRLETIRASASSLLNVLNDILDLSKFEAGHVDIDPAEFSIHDAVGEVMDQMVVRAHEKNLGIEWDVAHDVPSKVRTDPHRVKQILTNLIGNAIKFTSRGRVDVRISLIETNVPDRSDGHPRVRFAVRDTGPGLSDEDLAQLFEPFTQVDSSHTRKHGGAGLGLFLSKRLVESLGGKISVDSNLGEGSEFCFDIPLESGAAGAVESPAADLPSDALAETPSNSGRCFPTQPHILVVEDNPTNQAVVRQMLDHLGCSVEVASNGEDAIERFCEQDFDFIFMDYQMPVMDGLAATRIIRELESQRKDKRIPIVALTAHAMSVSRQECIEAGMDGYVTKPIATEQLARAIEERLGYFERPDTSPSVARPNRSGDTAQTHAELLDDSVLDGLLAMVEGDENFVTNLLDTFVERAAELAEEIEESLSSDDRDALGRAAHELKSSSAQVGAVLLPDIAMEVERAARSGDPAAPELAKQLVAGLDDFLRALAARGDARHG